MNGRRVATRGDSAGNQLHGFLNLAAVVFPALDLTNDQLHEVTSTSFSFRFALGAAVGQSSARCDLHELHEVRFTSAPSGNRVAASDRVALGRYLPRAPTDPYVPALEHTVPQIMVSLRT